MSLYASSSWTPYSKICGLQQISFVPDFPGKSAGANHQRGSLVSYKEINDMFGLTDMAAYELTDNQTGRNTQHSITAKSLDFSTKPAYLVMLTNGDTLGNYS